MNQDLPHQVVYCRDSARVHGLYGADMFSARAYLRAIVAALDQLGAHGSREVDQGGRVDPLGSGAVGLADEERPSPRQ